MAVLVFYNGCDLWTTKKRKIKTQTSLMPFLKIVEDVLDLRNEDKSCDLNDRLRD